MFSFLKPFLLFATISLLTTFLNSGKAQSGPGGVDNTEFSSRLNLWIDGNNVQTEDTLNQNNNNINGKTITGVLDRSGKGNTITIYGKNNLPFVQRSDSTFNGLPSISFLRKNQPSTKSGFLIENYFTSTDFTIYITLNIPPAKSYKKNDVQPVFNFNQEFENLDDLTKNSLKNFSLFFKNSQLVFSANEKKPQQHQVSLPVTPGVQYIVRLSCMGINGSLEISMSNGASKKLITSKPVLYSNANLLIGYDEQSPGSFSGNIASILAFSRILSSFEQLQIENFLSSKFNIPLSTNDLFLMDTFETGDFDYEVAGIGMSSDRFFAKEARGEGVIEIRNPGGLDINESLFWGRNKQLLQQLDSVDIPQGSSFRLSTSWAVTEKGDVGEVEIAIDSSVFRNNSRYQVYLVIDKNMNGSFADDSIFIFPKTPNSKFLTLKNISINDREQFTFGGIRDIGQSVSGLITPDGDGNEDSFYIRRRGMVRILDGNGFLVRELKAPGEWDGTNNDGQLVSPGRYQLEINETERIEVLIRY